MFILFNKPADVLCQFTDADGRRTLADFVDTPDVYSAGRLDKMSEGLLVLTNDGRLKNQISGAETNVEKTYWVQVEGAPDRTAPAALLKGIASKGEMLRAVGARLLPPPNLTPRQPPIRERKHIPTHWLEVVLRQGRNRQVRRMTAAIGLPTLRLVRQSIGPWSLEGLALGEQRSMHNRAAYRQLQQWQAQQRSTPPRSP